MKKIIFIICLLLSATGYATTVTRVVDGDTVVVGKKEHVRLLGVDTPEYHKSHKLDKDAQTTGCALPEIQSLGEKAYEYTNGLVLDKKVKMKYDREKKDKYKRTLAYLYLKDGRLVNLEIVKAGYGRAYTRFPFKHKDEFVAAEQEAKAAKRGFWAQPKCF